MNEVTVLLVDDEAEFVEALGERLRLRGLAVESAASGTAAIELARQRRFDAVLLDMAMPGLDGVETLSRLLADNPDLQVILLTGRATLAQAVTAMKLGALDLLEKPAPLATIVERIEEAATRRAARDDERIAQRMREITRKQGW